MNPSGMQLSAQPSDKLCFTKMKNFKQIKFWQNLPITVMLNWHDPSSGIESLALHVTVVKPTEYKVSDITTLPRLSSHTMVVELMSPSTVSLAVGDGDQVTLAVIVPADTFTETVLGQKTVGSSLSALGKKSKLF